MRIVQCVLIAATAIFLSACGNKTDDQPLDRLVEVATFSYQPATRVMDYPGRVQARYQSELSFQVGGRLIERLVDVGDVVQKGAPIAMLDAKDYVLSSESFSNQQKAAEADFQRAQRDLVRAKGLHKKKFIGQSDLDKAINIERASYAKLKALKAEHAQRVNQHGYTQLLAPADGIVTVLNAEVGNVVKAGFPIATLAWKNDWEFVTALSETDVNQLSVGESAMINFWAYSDKQYPALVREISPVSSENSPSYKVKLSLKGEPDGLKLGMTGHALFSKKEAHMGLLPTSAIVKLDGQTRVMTVDSNTKQVRSKAVTLGQSLGDEVSIVDGLKDGQWVVIAGANKITDGSTVRVLTNE
ncbi:MAG TPA: efflux RND transporter periplasmic adaptor subunit [Cycloclasticus sp.]|nr:efflux RND transporter periplasmic adaptor subunit [Cycloclasticus sp.]HIL91994.1 efflux RND transporter periplasmic adaptor subunit [Cycloclasticus sp.]